MKNFKFYANWDDTHKKYAPHVPVKPKEIIEQVLEVAGLGVNIAHLHARNLKT